MRFMAGAPIVEPNFACANASQRKRSPSRTYPFGDVTLIGAFRGRRLRCVPAAELPLTVVIEQLPERDGSTRLPPAGLIDIALQGRDHS